MNTPYGSLGRVGPEVQPLSLNAEDYRAEINDFVFAGRLTTRARKPTASAVWMIASPDRL